MADENVQIDNFPDFLTIGSGKVLIKKNGEGDDDWIDLCEVTEGRVNITVESLDFESSRKGAKRITKSSVTKQTFAGTIMLALPVPLNVQLFFMGSDPSDVSQASGSFTTTDVVLNFNKWTSLGKEKIGTTVLLQDDTDTTTYVEGTDYIIDRDNGVIAPISTTGGGSIGDGDTCHITADYEAVTISKIVVGQERQQERHFWFIGDPADGVRQTIRGYANMIPDGDFNLITGEWQTYSINLSFQDHPDYSGPFEYYDRGTQ